MSLTLKVIFVSDRLEILSEYGIQVPEIGSLRRFYYKPSLNYLEPEVP